MPNLWTVAKFTFRNRLKARAFLVSTVLFLLMISLAVNLPAIIHHFSSGKPLTIGMIEDSSGIARSLQGYLKTKENPDTSILLVPPAGNAQADEAKLDGERKAGKIQGYLLLVPNKANGFPDGVYKADKVLSEGRKNELTQTLQLVRMSTVSRTLGLTSQQLTQLQAPVNLQTFQLDSVGSGKTEAEHKAAYALVYALLFLIFMMVQTYGSLIAAEVTAEKSSRVMELLITSTSALSQMFGKILGMFLLAMLQMVLFVGAGAANLALGGNLSVLSKMGLDLRHTPASLLIDFLIFFVLGFFLYATMLAGVGSIVSRSEDLGQAVLPITLLSLASFYISIYSINDPTSSFTVAASFIPIFTPMLMFLRIGMVGVPVWQVGLSLAELLAFILLAGWLSAKIYRVGVLLYGKRPGWKEIFRAMKAFKA